MFLNPTMLAWAAPGPDPLQPWTVHAISEAGTAAVGAAVHGLGVGDVNHDGRVDIHDAEVILQAVDKVERDNPSLVGGVGVYSACCGHGPFTHIDVRGFRARWRGFGNG